MCTQFTEGWKLLQTTASSIPKEAKPAWSGGTQGRQPCSRSQAVMLGCEDSLAVLSDAHPGLAPQSQTQRSCVEVFWAEHSMWKVGLLCPDLLRYKLQMFYTAKYSKFLSLTVPFELPKNFSVVIYPDRKWIWENKSHGNGEELSLSNPFYSNRKKQILCSRTVVFSPLMHRNTCTGTVYEWILLVLTKLSFKVHLFQSDGMGKKMQHLFPIAKCQFFPF